MYERWIALFLKREDGSQRTSGPQRAKLFNSLTVTVFLVAAAGFLSVSNVLAGEDQDEVKVQGGWAYTSKGSVGAVEHLATTPAADGDVWLVLACSGNERLTVSLIHTEQFPFPLKPSSSVQLRSNNLPTVSIEGKSNQNNQIFVDPRPMRHMMPLLAQEDQLVVSIPERDGVLHDYTFSMQPNDLALRSIRLHCFEL